MCQTLTEIKAVREEQQMKARDLIEEGQSAVAVFTSGRKLEINSDSSGSTGNWVVRGDLDVDRVIIYHRREAGDNEVYLATYDGLTRAPDEPARSRIKSTNAHSVGVTENNWKEFAGPGQNPVRYIQ
jgi:hypothetical protein